MLGTGWYAADAARVQPGSTVVVVGDGAVGLMGVLAAKQMDAGRIIAMSRHKTRQDLALEYGATDIVSERGEQGIARIKELTNRIGADSVLECVGTQESMNQALQVRPARFDDRLCRRAARRAVRRPVPVLHAGRHARRPGSVRRFLPHLMDLVLTRKINPGKVFDSSNCLSADVAEGYKAMDERRAIKTMLRVSRALLSG